MQNKIEKETRLNVFWKTLFSTVKNHRTYGHGQGVIEYAGAIVIAVVLVSLVLVVFPNPLTDFFFEIIETALNTFIGYLP